MYNLKLWNCSNKIIKIHYLFSSALITDGSVKFSPTPLYIYVKKIIYIMIDINTDMCTIKSWDFIASSTFMLNYSKKYSFFLLIFHNLTYDLNTAPGTQLLTCDSELAGMNASSWWHQLLMQQGQACKQISAYIKGLHNLPLFHLSKEQLGS